MIKSSSTCMAKQVIVLMVVIATACSSSFKAVICRNVEFNSKRVRDSHTFVD